MCRPFLWPLSSNEHDNRSYSPLSLSFLSFPILCCVLGLDKPKLNFFRPRGARSSTPRPAPKVTAPPTPTASMDWRICWLRRLLCPMPTTERTWLPRSSFVFDLMRKPGTHLMLGPLLLFERHAILWKSLRYFFLGKNMGSHPLSLYFILVFISNDKLVNISHSAAAKRKCVVKSRSSEV